MPVASPSSIFHLFKSHFPRFTYRKLGAQTTTGFFMTHILFLVENIRHCPRLLILLFHFLAQVRQIIDLHFLRMKRRPSRKRKRAKNGKVAIGNISSQKKHPKTCVIPSTVIEDYRLKQGGKHQIPDIASQKILCTMACEWFCHASKQMHWMSSGFLDISSTFSLGHSSGMGHRKFTYTILVSIPSILEMGSNGFDFGSCWCYPNHSIMLQSRFSTSGS